LKRAGKSGNNLTSNARAIEQKETKISVGGKKMIDIMRKL
jgi:hypothetical protein